MAEECPGHSTNCREELKKLGAKSVRLAITSPPYNLQKDYAQILDKEDRTALHWAIRGEESIATICCREGINPNLYYRWSKSFLE